MRGVHIDFLPHPHSKGYPLPCIVAHALIGSQVQINSYQAQNLYILNIIYTLEYSVFVSQGVSLPHAHGTQPLE